MANEGHSHWPHMGCQWLGSMGNCNKLPRGAHIFAPTNAQLGQHGTNVRCHHPANKIPWASWGANRNTSAVARPGKYDETGSCKVIVSMEHKMHLKEVSCEITKWPGNWSACLWQNYPHTYVLILQSVQKLALALHVVHIEWPMKLPMQSHCLITH